MPILRVGAGSGGQTFGGSGRALQIWAEQFGARVAGAARMRDLAMPDTRFPSSGKRFAGYAVTVAVQPMWVAGFLTLIEPLSFRLTGEIRAVAVVPGPRV